MPRLPMRARRTVAIAAGSALCAVVAAQAPQQPTFRGGVDLVQLDVSVI